MGLATAQLGNVVLAADPATTAVADAARAALTEGTQSAAWTAAGFLVLGLVASLRLRSTPTSAAAGDPKARQTVAH